MEHATSPILTERKVSVPAISMNQKRFSHARRRARRDKALRGLALWAWMATAFASDAAAYVDPGSGSYLFQLVVAAALGGLYAVKAYFHHIAAFVRRLFSFHRSDDARGE